MSWKNWLLVDMEGRSLTSLESVDNPATLLLRFSKLGIALWTT